MRSATTRRAPLLLNCTWAGSGLLTLRRRADPARGVRAPVGPMVKALMRAGLAELRTYRSFLETVRLMGALPPEETLETKVSCALGWTAKDVTSLLPALTTKRNLRLELRMTAFCDPRSPAEPWPWVSKAPAKVSVPSLARV